MSETEQRVISDYLASNEFAEELALAVRKAASFGSRAGSLTLAEREMWKKRLDQQTTAIVAALNEKHR